VFGAIRREFVDEGGRNIQARWIAFDVLARTSVSEILLTGRQVRYYGLANTITRSWEMLSHSTVYYPQDFFLLSYLLIQCNR